MSIGILYLLLIIFFLPKIVLPHSFSPTLRIGAYGIILLESRWPRYKLEIQPPGILSKRFGQTTDDPH